MSTSRKKIAAVILAAGAGSRMGRTKQLLKFGNTTILGQVIEHARDAAFDEIILVLGHDADRIRRTIDLRGVKAIHNPRFERGQSSSLIKGVDGVSDTCDAAMFLLGDQPLIAPDTMDRIMDAFVAESAGVAIPYFNGQRGNPVIVARPLFDKLRSLTGDVGVRALFGELAHAIVKVPVLDPSVLMDIDTQADYECYSANGSNLTKSSFSYP